MAAVKTAITIERRLFQRASRTAREMRIPRSRLFAMAMQSFLKLREEQEWVEELNRVYANGPDAEDRKLLDASYRMAGEQLKKSEW